MLYLSNSKWNKTSVYDHNFALKNALQLHVKSVYEGMKPFQCESCFAKFVQTAGLDKHNYNFTI